MLTVYRGHDEPPWIGDVQKRMKVSGPEKLSRKVFAIPSALGGASDCMHARTWWPVVGVSLPHPAAEINYTNVAKLPDEYAKQFTGLKVAKAPGMSAADKAIIGPAIVRAIEIST
eukprot:6461312-Amphidinium_carterae.1